MVRPERPGEAREIFAVHAAAFGRSLEARIVDEVRAGDRYIAELSLVAEVEGQIVGHVLVSEFDLAGDGRVLQLGPLGVLPELQRRGIGSALMEAAIAACRLRGARIILLEGDPRYYSRFGFEPAVPHGLLPPPGTPEWAFQVLPLGGEMPRGAVEYPPAFQLEADTDV